MITVPSQSYALAVDDSYTTNEDDAPPLVVAAPGVGANDLPAGATVLVVGHDDSGLNGTLAINEDGSFTYNANGQFETLSVGDTAQDTFTYDMLALGDPLVDRGPLLAPLGEGGTFNAYLLDSVGRTWDEARINAATETFGGKTGHMVTIGSAAENQFIVDLGGNFWIGLTDATTTSGIDGFDFNHVGHAGERQPE